MRKVESRWPIVKAEDIAYLHDGSLYQCMDEGILDEQIPCQDLLWEYNQTKPSEGARRRELLERMCAEVGKDAWIEAPVHANWGLRFVHIGNEVYANYNLTLVDDTHIYIGNRVLLGPNVTIATAGHPLAPELRAEGSWQYNMPVHIGDNCWLGAGVIVVPGVTIGDNTVVGAGSVVTRDLPANVLAMGTPCKVVRELGEHDRRFYWRDRPIDWDVINAQEPLNP